MREDHLPPPIGCVDTIVEIFGPAWFIQEQGTATGPTTVISQRRNDFVWEMDVFAWITVIIPPAEMVHAHIPTTTIVGIVSCESSQKWIHGNLENVSSAFAVEFHSRTVGTYSYYPSTSKL